MDQLLAMRVFLRIIETNSFIRTANQLAIPRSTVSKLVIELERHLGVKLIQRTTRMITPTSEGLEYYNHAMRIVSDLDAIDSAIRGIKQKPRGHLRVDAPASFASSILIPELPSFRREYPDVTMSLGISDRTVNIIGEGVDCAIRAGEIHELTMIARKIFDLQFVTCVSPIYLERMGKPLSPSDLQENHVKVGYFNAVTGKPEALIFNKGKEHFEISEQDISTNEGNGLIGMMLAGLGIGQHLKRFVQPYLDSGKLITVLDDWTRPALSFHIVYPPNRHQSARLKVFVDWVLNEIAPEKEPQD